MKIKKYLPPKYLIALIIIVSCADAFHYAFLIQTQPINYEFVGLTTDEAITFGLMNSPSMNFLNPWNIDKNENIFTTLSLTTPYIYVPLGMLAEAASITPLAMNAIAKIVFNIIFFLVAYNFLAVFTKRQNTAMIIFILVSGISGILYFLALPFGKDVLNSIGNMFAYYEFEKVTLLHYQLYYNLPKITGMLAILFYSKNRVILSGFLLGLTTLFYPVYGFGFFVGIFIYAVIFSKKLMDLAKNIVKVGVITFIFLLPWTYMYLSNPAPFKLYSAEYFSSAWLAGIYISFAIPLIFAFYYLYTHVPAMKSKKFIACFVAFTVVFSLYQILHTGIGRNNQFLTNFLDVHLLLSFVNALNGAPLILEAVSLLTFFLACFYVYRSRIDGKIKFAAIWMFALIAFAVITPSAAFWFPQRMAFIMRLPIVILATFGLLYFSSSRKIPVKKILAIMIILSLPSLAAAEIRYDRLGREDVTSYSSSDVAALKFLRNEPLGVMFSSPKIGSFGPSIANKKSVEFGWPTPIIVGNYSEKYNDYMNFYSSPFNHLVILSKYKVDYVFLGERELSVSNNSSIFDNVKSLKKIYDLNGTKIYRVLK